MKLPILQNSKGMTVVELLVAAFLFSIFSLTLFAVFNLSNIIIRTNDVHTRLTFDGMQVLRSVDREIRQTSYTTDRLVITTDGNSNSVVRFQVPVDYDDDGDVVSSSLTKSVEWGAYDNAQDTTKGTYGNNPLNRWTRYSVTNGQLIRDVLDATLTAVSSLSRVMANDVQSFTVTQASTTILTITINFSAQDKAGQSGSARTIQSSFTNKTILRNAPT